MRPTWLAVFFLIAGNAAAASYRYENCAAVTSAFPWRDISVTGTTLGLADDANSAAIPLGFTFNFGGTNYTQLSISANGWLFFGGTSTTYTNTALPAAGADAVLIPYWDDLNPASVATRIPYQVLGTAPNRIFVVSYLSVPHYCSCGTGCTGNQTTALTETFQARLYETSNEIVFSYNTLSTFGNGWSTGPTPTDPGATIGVEVSNTDYTQYSFNTNSIANGSTLLFSSYSAAPRCGGTRFYMQNAAPDVTVATHRGVWDQTASVLQRKLSRTKAGAIASLGVAETSTTNNWDVLLLKMVSEPIATSQTISGFLNWFAGAQESNAAQNANWHVHVYVTQGNTDTLRGTLYSDYSEAAGINEWPTTAAGDGPVTPLRLTAVAALANDRIVIEAGYSARNTVATSYTGTLWYGGTLATDLWTTGVVNTNPGWWEFSQDLFPVIAPHHLEIQHGSGAGVTCTPSTLTVKACADALATCTPYTAGVSGTLSATGMPTVNWAGGSASFTIAAGSSTVTKDIQVTTVGSVVLGAASTPAAATTCDFGTPSCTYTSALAGFLFDVPNHVSDTLQTINVSAVKQSDSSLACTSAFASTSKTVGFACSYSNPSSGTRPVAVNGTNIACGTPGAVSLAFNGSGVASTTFRHADVGSISVAATYTGSGGTETGLVMSGGDSFIAAPANFTLVSTGPYVAGAAFSASATAKNASGNTTPNFGKESTPETAELKPVTTAVASAINSQLVGPVGGATGTLTAGAFTLAKCSPASAGSVCDTALT